MNTALAKSVKQVKRSYPKTRKPKLSRPEDAEWFEKSFIREDAKGKRRRFITGLCEVCGVENTTTWSNFSTRGAYRFRHLKCAQSIWNSGQFRAAQNRSPLDNAERLAKKYQHGARARGIDWRLHVVEVLHLTQAFCFYCNAAPSSRYSRHFTYNGIDRKDNDKGYTLENCVTCCKRCNFLKRDMPYIEWMGFLMRVASRWKGQ